MVRFLARAGLAAMALAGLGLSGGPSFSQPAPAPAKAARPATTGATAPAAKAAPAPVPAAAAATPDRPSALGNLGSSKEPIKIDSDRLDVFDREGRAVFQGNVVAVQGDSTMQCTVMIVFYEQSRGQAGAKTTAGPAASESAIKKIDCKGPVTVVSKTQTATGDRAEFDRAANKVVLTGNVALSDGPNVTRGERIVYDTVTGIANVETNPGGRVKALFIPGSNENKDPEKKLEEKKAAGDKKTEEKKPADRKAEPQKRNAAAN